MERLDDVYRELQRHLDKQPIGFPESKSGAEIRILKRFFTPQQAELTTHLNYKLSTAEQVYESVRDGDLSLVDVERMLEEIATAGAIGRVEKDGRYYYHTKPLVVGMHEAQLGKLDPEYLSDLDTYTHDRAFGLSFLSTEVPQMRTIPVEKSLTVEHAVTNYDSLVEVLNASKGPYGVGECICRQEAGIKGNPCKKTSRLETCMAVGDVAKLAIDSGAFREITREDALGIARLNQADGLVLQPSNNRKIDFICACCGCCCGMLNVLKSLPEPVDFWATNYYATSDADLCDGCGTCVDRCEMEAVTVTTNGSDIPRVQLNRCIGCGVCVTTCPTGAMRLVKKSEEIAPPLDLQDMYETIMEHKKGALGKM